MSSVRSVVLVGGALLLGGSAFAQWNEDPTVNSMVSSTLGDAYTQKAVSDGKGGIIIGWYDDRNGSSDIFAQRLDPMGRKLWGPDGIAICTADGTQDDLRIASDGEGGALIAWDDGRTGANGIYVQRVDFDGNALWTSNGVRALYDTNCCSVASDGKGGAVVLCYSSAIVNRISASGSLLWGTADAPISYCTGSTSYDKITGDGNGGAFIAYEDSVLSQGRLLHLNASGSTDWAVKLTDDGSCFRLVSDGGDGVFVMWEDDVTSTIRAQHVGGSGSALWGSGVQITDDYNSPYGFGVVPSGTGAIVTWIGGDDNPHAALVRAGGSVAWSKGLSSLGHFYDGTYPPDCAVSDGKGGAVITWTDYDGSDYLVRAQRVNQVGNVLWGDGVTASIGTSSCDCPRIVGDGKGGAIVHWYDDRIGVGEIYAQKVSSSGELGSGGHDHMWWCFAGSAPTSGMTALGLLAGALVLLGLSRLVRK